MKHARTEPAPYGRAYSAGSSFRARAEARQREFRADTLRVGCGAYGHLLDDAATAAGANFVTPDAFAAARARDAAGKGVGERTFRNMLSSQAMAFNVFTPLAHDTELAARVLAPFIPGLTLVRSITIEYTPPPDVFNDQSGLGGVDCDVLIEATTSQGTEAVVVVETKFVETELSTCGFRKSGRAARGLAICPPDVAVGASRDACGYVARKRYRYWEQTDALKTLTLLPAIGCPFGGPLWQLWVNHTLAHAEAKRRGAPEARFLLCAPSGNAALLRDGAVFASFAALLARPETAAVVPLDALLDRIVECVDSTRQGWTTELRLRYARI